jgi:allantoin racemase
MTHLRIRVVLPILRDDDLTARVRQEYLHAAGGRTEIDFVTLGRGTRTIESAYDLALNAPDVISRCREAQSDAFDAVVIDPGASGAKSAVSIPVVGEGEAAMHMASLLGARFSVVTVGDDTIPLVREAAVRVRLLHKLASVRKVNCGVRDFGLDRIEEAAAAAALAIMEDQADVLVMGVPALALAWSPQSASASMSTLESTCR